MKTMIDKRLRAEAKLFLLRFSCDDCAHFDHDRAACVHGYPLEDGRRDMRLVGESVSFCKEFELGEGGPTGGGVEGAGSEGSR
jgi:hypothetical protein